MKWITGSNRSTAGDRTRHRLTYAEATVGQRSNFGGPRSRPRSAGQPRPSCSSSSPHRVWREICRSATPWWRTKQRSKHFECSEPEAVLETKRDERAQHVRLRPARSFEEMKHRNQIKAKFRFLRAAKTHSRGGARKTKEEDVWRVGSPSSQTEIEKQSGGIHGRLKTTSDVKGQVLPQQSWLACASRSGGECIRCSTIVPRDYGRINRSVEDIRRLSCFTAAFSETCADFRFTHRAVICPCSGTDAGPFTHQKNTHVLFYAIYSDASRETHAGQTRLAFFEETLSVQINVC